MKDLFNKILLEVLNNSKQELIDEINEKYNNLIEKGQKHSNFVFLMPDEIERYDPYIPHCAPNKCETNAFKFIKYEYEVHDIEHYYPVGGYGFANLSLTPIVHWWVYDKKNNKHLEITPMLGGGFKCYAGGINYDINDKIYKAEKYHDVNFFRYGTPESMYFK